MKLYYAPDNASLILRLALDEAKIPFETILVDRSQNEQNSDHYRALNPAGVIPTLITDDGLVLSETAACLLWLSDTYPEAELGPTLNDPNRGAFLRWLFFLSNTLHADLIRLFYAERYVPASALDAQHPMMVKRLRNHLDVLEEIAKALPTLFAPPYALALYLGPLLRWAQLYPTTQTRWLDLKEYPALFEILRTLETRPSVVRATASEGLGETPFTAAELPNPPEGSAL